MAVERKDVDITSNMSQWIIDELQFKAIVYERTHTISLYNGDVTKSDIGVPESFRQKFIDGVRPLDELPMELQFFTPGTKKKQRDIIPIGLFPLVYGRSRILRDRLIGVDDAIANAGQGDIIPCPEETGITREDIAWRVTSRDDITIRPYSRNFQILPTDLKLVDGRWRIDSYINNMHPTKHRHLYDLIEELFNLTVQQWNGTLTPLKDMLHSRARIEYKKAEYYPLPKEVEDQTPKPEPGEAANVFDERLEDWRMKNQTTIQPDAGKFAPWAVPLWMMSNLPPDLPSPVRIEEGVDLNRDYCDRGLQLVVRIISLELQPEDQEFGTDWHVEGQMVSSFYLRVQEGCLTTSQNEHICATAFYCFQSENMENVTMQFRHIAETESLDEVVHDPNDSVWLKQVFGFDDGDPPIQHSGNIICRPGRVVMYPSTVQHRFSGFKLIDPTKPGATKALAMFLVDPNIRIISTANVPPQRLDWTFTEADFGDLSLSLDKLSVEFQDRKGNLPLSMSEARKVHDDFLRELGEFTKYQHVAFESKVVSVGET